MRELHTIFIHATATQPDWMANRPAEDKVNEIRRWHIDRGFSDIGYNFLIDRDGTIAEGRPIEHVPAAQKGHNVGSVAVSLIGGFGGEQDDLFSEHYTDAQERALRQLIARLRAEYPSIKKVRGHNEVSSKSCPCFMVAPWLKNKIVEKPKPKKTIAASKTIQASTITKIAGASTPLVGTIGGLEWPQLLILAGLAVVILVATGLIDIERIKKWNKGDR